MQKAETDQVGFLVVKKPKILSISGLLKNNKMI